jgi:cell division protease FtsH
MSSGKNVSADISPETAKLIDEEVKKLVDNAYVTASKILHEHRDELEILAKALLEYETLTGDEIKELLKGNKPHRTSKSGEENKVARKKKVGFGSLIGDKDSKKEDKKENND